MATRADLLATYAECKTYGDEVTCEQIAESAAELDAELRALGVRGRLAPLDATPKPVNAQPGAGKTPRIYPAGRSNTAP
jgi:hypothetical protein